MAPPGTTPSRSTSPDPQASRWRAPALRTSGLFFRRFFRRIAHRIVWAIPRTQSPRYRPEVGGMAAAWPYCDAVVSAHSLDALSDLLAALRAR